MFLGGSTFYILILNWCCDFFFSILEISYLFHEITLALIFHNSWERKLDVWCEIVPDRQSDGYESDDAPRLSTKNVKKTGHCGCIVKSQSMSTIPYPHPVTHGMTFFYSLFIVDGTIYLWVVFMMFQMEYISVLL